VNLLERLRAPLERAGLNHLGVVGRARYDAAAPASLAMEQVSPGARSVLVVGSGGRAHWDRFLEYVAVDPRTRFAGREHPLDDFCAETFESLALELAGCRVVFPTFRAELRLDFMKLASLAGLGAESELGILVGERFGPWFGLRAAIFTPEELPETFARRSPCVGCAAPCRAPCPARIVGSRPFPWQACVAERASRCTTGCGARDACVIAPDERYDPLELRYHHDPRAGRRALCERFGISDQLE